MQGIRSHLRCAAFGLATAVSLLLVMAPEALAKDGRGLYGATNDKVITNGGFIVIAFFPLLALVLTLIQGRLEKRKEARKAAAHIGNGRWRGGW